ncbi:DUF4837 family protein [soil metagenome]
MTRLLLTLVLGLMMFSCGDTLKTPNYLPASGGGADEVMVVAEDKLWKNTLEQPVSDLLNREFEVLPQYEPLFKFGYVNYESLRGLVKQHRNLIIFADLSDQTSRVSQLVTSALGEDYTAKALNNPGFSYAIKRNIWSTPQIVVFIFAAGPQQLVANLGTSGTAVIDAINKHEVEFKYTPGLYSPNYQVKLTNKVKEHLNINLRIPPEYFQALEKPNFLWYRWEPQEASNNLFIYTEAMPALIDPMRPLYLRDSLGKAYVSTKADSAYMATDTMLPYVQRYITVNGFEMLETRGLWQMENDFMGGPFINYYILDKANNRAVMLDGFIFSPKGQKKMRIRFMEAIFATFQQPLK